MQHLVGGISSAGRAIPALDGQRFLVERASGAHIWGKDGRRYIDTALGFGAIVLGHADTVVNEAVLKAVERGSMPAFAHDGEEEAAAAIAAACGPLSSVMFTNSGSEAVHMACRIARAVTGRRTIAKMAAGFDGWFDAVALGNAGSPEALIGNGPRPERNDVTLLRFNDMADAERLFAERSDIAAIIVEPLLANAGCVEAASDYLAKLQELARRNGTLLIADEVLMGFRMRYGLASHALGFDPDIVTLGKAIGNGFAVAALAGRPEILAAAADGRAVRAGTYSGNPVATAAVSAAMQRLKASDYDRLEARGQRLRNHLVDSFAERGLTVSTSGLGMVFTLWFGKEPPATYEMAAATADQERTVAFHTALRRADVMTMPQAFGRFYLSFAHDDAVMEAMEEAVTTAVRSLPLA